MKSEPKCLQCEIPYNEALGTCMPCLRSARRSAVEHALKHVVSEDSARKIAPIAVAEIETASGVALETLAKRLGTTRLTIQRTAHTKDAREIRSYPDELEDDTELRQRLIERRSLAAWLGRWA